MKHKYQEMARKPGSVYLEKKTRLSLDDRFSQILLKQLTLRLNNKTRAKRGSVWTRIGWRSHRSRGAWNFRSKYRQTARWSSAPTAAFSTAHNTGLSSALRTMFSHTPKRAAQSGVLSKRRVLRPTPRHFKGQPVQRRHLGGVALTSRGRGLQRRAVPTKEELDAELDRYMSKTRSRLDKELDDYMSLSKSHLDAELDEYMALAGETSV